MDEVSMFLKELDKLNKSSHIYGVVTSSFYLNFNHWFFIFQYLKNFYFYFDRSITHVDGEHQRHYGCDYEIEARDVLNHYIKCIDYIPSFYQTLKKHLKILTA